MITEPTPAPHSDAVNTTVPVVPELAASGAPHRAPVRMLWVWVGTSVLTLISLLSIGVAWKAQQRVVSLEQILVSRQEASHREASQAQALAKLSSDKVLEASAKVALLEARMAEVTVQRGQFEELMQSLSRSRDENVLVDIEAGLRMALQQAAITGSAETLVAALKQSDDRLASYNRPRLEAVRRAIARDLEKVKAVAVMDVATLSIKLDEVVRLVDDLPLLSRPEVRKPAAGATDSLALSASRPVVSRSTPLPPEPTWSWWSTQDWSERWNQVIEHVLTQARSLVQVTRIDHPEAMLLSPEQSFFLRENLKLRLLNARLALMSRQFEIAQSDLQLVLLSFDRYFDRQGKRTVIAIEAVRSVATQARQVVVPRPDNTLAALSALGSTR